MRKKIIFLWEALTPYYTLVLNRLQQDCSYEVIHVGITKTNAYEKHAVFLSDKDAQFQTKKLPLMRVAIFSHLRGLLSFIINKRPEVIVTTPVFAYMLVLNPVFLVARFFLGYRILLKSIPFRTLKFDESKAAVSNGTKLTTKFKLAILHYLNHYMYNAVDGHVCYIDEAFEIYGSWGVPKERIFITGNSPDTDHFMAIRKKLELSEPKPKRNPYRLIHVGRLVAWKRVDLLIDAVAELVPEFPNIELIVVGYGPEETPLKARVAEIGIQDRVEFTGGVYDTEEIGKLFRSCGLYVLAGMGGLSINDAMCFGLPVVCSVCDGTEKVLVHDGQNGFFFREGNLADLKEIIAKILRDDKLAELMGNESTRIIREEVNIHRVLRGYSEAFEENRVLQKVEKL